MSHHRIRVGIILMVLVGGLLFSAVLAIGMGSVWIPPGEVIEVLTKPVDLSDTNSIIVHNMRLCRVIASILGGAALALSGLLLQILFHNPIADPYVLGISSGARLFVGLAILGGVTFGMSVTNSWFMFLGAFIGSLVMMFVILAFARRLKSITTLLIVGMMLSYLCSAVVGILTSLSDDKAVADFTRWGMGSFGMMTWDNVRVLAIVCVIFFIGGFLLSKNLNLLLLGEAYAKTMGVNTRLLRILIILVSGVLTAVVTAFAGPVAFIGMSVPHMARLLLKSEDSRILIPTSLLLGGVFGVVCDLLARTVAAPGELAVGNITSCVGVPIVLFLLLRKNRANPTER
ncbi:MAG: FecCD family ABC transporter permease [Candidatus Merdivicinus sp.]